MKSSSHSRSLLRLLPELPAVLASALVAAAVEVGLRVTTLPRLARFLGTPLASGPAAALAGPGPAQLPSWARRRVSATGRVLRHWPFGDTCLRQALVSGQRLRRLHPSLHVGVAKLDGEVRAHAWLVVRGRILDPMRAAGGYLDLGVPGEGGGE